MYGSIEDFLTPEEEQQVIDAICKAEQNTSGEIRVHIESNCDGHAIKRAQEVFSILDMYNTRLQNAVLIYVAVNDHQFAIYGDKGIDSVVNDSFWNQAKDAISEHFKGEAFAKGLVEGISLVGEQLKSHFPWRTTDENELPDSISTPE